MSSSGDSNSDPRPSGGGTPGPTGNNRPSGQSLFPRHHGDGDGGPQAFRKKDAVLKPR